MTSPETSHRNRVGVESHPVEPGQQPEASLAWSVVRPAAKRRQRRCRTMLLSPENAVVGVLAVSTGGDRGRASQWPDATAPAGVVGTWWTSTGVPQEQERPVTFREWKRLWGGAAPKRPGPRLCSVDRRESGLIVAGTAQTDAGRLVVRTDETNESARKKCQESECLHSTAIHSGDSRSGPRGAN